MMNTSRSQEVNLQPGTTIVGRWHQNSYYIKRKLGSGAIGTVYLAKDKHNDVALKISSNDVSITSEVNVLKRFSKVQGKILGPSLIDVDDYIVGSNKYSFYVMEYLSGVPIIEFINNRGKEWLSIFIIQLLNELHQLHKAGWVFGDLKPDNLLITGPPPKIRWLDVGGTTLIGRSIKEYTEFFDRGYWGLGTRKAEPSYDLFAVAMIMLNIVYPNRFEKKNGGLTELKSKIDRSSILMPYQSQLLKAIQGNYTSANEMKSDLLHAINSNNGVSTSYNKTVRKKAVNNTGHNPKRNHYQKQNTSRRKQKSKIKGIVETFLLASVVLLAYVLYLFGQTI